MCRDRERAKTQLLKTACFKNLFHLLYFLIKNKQNTPLFYSGDECYKKNKLIVKMPRSSAAG